MTTDPTITAEDRAAAREIMNKWPSFSCNDHIAAIIARHREQREKRLVEALRFYARQDNHQHHKLTGQEIDIDGGETARQALKEEGYDLSEKGANE